MVFKFIFYVPETHLEQVKSAVFKAGAGIYGNYIECCWQILGTGQFKPLAGSQPHIGDINEHSTVEEYRVETICKEEAIQGVIKALKDAHPYEWPVYDTWQLSHYSSI
jgi:structural hemagglutinin/hemolysin toxin protein RtxA